LDINLSLEVEGYSASYMSTEDFWSLSYYYGNQQVTMYVNKYEGIQDGKVVG